jgi:ubiquinone/menaquinone biosynthesis C-methylase UbiE
MLDAMARQLAQPTGLLGRLTGRLMNRWNRSMHASALSALGVQRGDRVLEIGFGGGATLGPLLRAARSGSVVGLELSATMVARARRHHRSALDEGRLELRLGSAEYIPFPDESFDRVLTINTLYFWPEASRALGEIYRVLRPGGRFVLAVRPKQGMQRGHAEEHGFVLREDAEVQDLLQEAHLRIVALDRHEDHRLGHIVVVAEKSSRAG